MNDLIDEIMDIASEQIGKALDDCRDTNASDTQYLADFREKLTKLLTEKYNMCER